jgi:hypothetical protein
MGTKNNNQVFNTLPDDRFQAIIINSFKPLSDVKTWINHNTNTYNILLVSPLSDSIFKPKDEDANFKIFKTTNNMFKASYVRPYGYLSAEVTLPDEFETREQALHTLITFINNHLVKSK